MSEHHNALSYSLGFNIGHQLKGDFKQLSIEELSRALAQAYSGQEPELSMSEMQTAIQQAQHAAQIARQAEMQEAAGKNAEEGTAFLAETAQREGVSTTDTGLQYEVITPAEGDKPQADSQVTVHYHGTLPNGEVFDSSVQRGEPATFGLNQVIPGWTEGVQLMSVGSKFRFFVPSDLAYGANGAGNSIGPNQALVFEVELLAIA